MSTTYIPTSSRAAQGTEASSTSVPFLLSSPLPVAFSLPSKTFFQLSPCSPSTSAAAHFCGNRQRRNATPGTSPLSSPQRTTPLMIAVGPSAGPPSPSKGLQSRRRRSFAPLNKPGPANANSPTSIVSCEEQFIENIQGTDIGCTASQQPVLSGPRFSSVRAERKMRFYMPRLSSKEDPMWFHKLSSLTFTLSSFIIVLMFPFRAVMYGDLGLPDAHILNPLLWAWIPSCVIEAVTGAQMAYQFRRTDPKSRDVFVNNSIMTLINVWVVLKLCVPLSAPFNSYQLSEVLMTVMCVSVLYMTGVSVYNAPELIRTRNRKKKIGRHKKGKYNKVVEEGKTMTFEEKVEWTMDYVNYIFPFFYPLPFIIGSFLFFVGRDSTWIAEQCAKFPYVRSVALYVNVAAALTIGIISLLVTLRDRKLVSKKTESVGISVISILLTGFLFETLRVLIGFDALHVLRPDFWHVMESYLHAV